MSGAHGRRSRAGGRASRNSERGAGQAQHRRGRHSAPASAVTSPSRQPPQGAAAAAAATTRSPAHSPVRDKEGGSAPVGKVDPLSSTGKSGINTSECAICMDGPKDTLLAPCGHVCCCNGCAKRLHTRADKCPVCRATIESIFKVFKV